MWERIRAAVKGGDGAQRGVSEPSARPPLSKRPASRFPERFEGGGGARAPCPGAAPGRPARPPSGPRARSPRNRRRRAGSGLPLGGTQPRKRTDPLSDLFRLEDRRRGAAVLTSSRPLVLAGARAPRFRRRAALSSPAVPPSGTVSPRACSLPRTRESLTPSRQVLVRPGDPQTLTVGDARDLLLFLDPERRRVFLTLPALSALAETRLGCTNERVSLPLLFSSAFSKLQHSVPLCTC